MAAKNKRVSQAANNQAPVLDDAVNTIAEAPNGIL